MMLQFRAQTMTYRAQFPQARFDIIELAGIPMGRIVVDRPGTMVHIVDQALSPPYRNLGIRQRHHARPDGRSGPGQPAAAAPGRFA